MLSRSAQYFICALTILILFIFFFFNDTATTEIYTLSLHDALPISTVGTVTEIYDYLRLLYARIGQPACPTCGKPVTRSEEHTSELQSRSDLVCRLLLEKKKNKTHNDGLQHHTESTIEMPDTRIIRL